MYGYDVAVQPVGYLGFPQNGYGPPPNTTKKIQNYQFKLNEVLGKGNFSKVYRGINELNSTHCLSNRRLARSHQGGRDEQHQNTRTSRSSLL